MNEAELFDKAMTLVARMRFVSEASGANLEQEPASADADRSPKWNGLSLEEEWLRRFSELVDEGEKKLHRAQHSPKPPLDQQRSFREHILSAHKDRSVRDAAAIEKVSPSYVQQVRDEERKRGRNPTQGERDAPERR